MAADLVRREVSVIVAFTTPAVRAAKAATGKIPVVFTTISDPVQIGLVSSLSRPGGNLTGVTLLNLEIGPKLLELLHEVIPGSALLALIVNPTNPTAATFAESLTSGAHKMGLQLHVLNASTENDLDAAFAKVRELGAAGVMIGRDAFFNSQIAHLAALSTRYAVPTIYQEREFAVAGGLMSYSSSDADLYRQAGLYTGRILKGEKPADLPVMQTTKLELVINLKTARTLGVTMPLPLLGRADEVIE